jgi:serine protease
VTQELEMRRGCLVSSVVVLALSIADARAQSVSPATVKALLERRQPLTFVPGEVIVKRKGLAGPAAAMARDRLRRLGLAPSPRPTSGGELIYTLAPAPASGPGLAERTRAAVAALGQDPDVEYAQLNYVLHIVATTPDDPGYARQWHYFENGSGKGRSPGGINLPLEWDTNTGSASVVVAVIDTGIRSDHPDIAGSPNLVAGYDMIASADTANDGDGRDPDPFDPGDGAAPGECGPGSPRLPDSWHGTHVAGTIGVGRTNNGLGVAGVNWSVRVQPIRVLGRCGGSIADINDAIRWAAGLAVPGVPENRTPARVVNMSLGGSGACTLSPATQRAIDDAVAAGTTVVVAAGNDAADASDFMPASCDGVITVAASDFRGRLVTRYSNFGPTVEILAPGGDVDRDDDHDGSPDGVYSMVKDGYAYYNGTSMAAPHVAGVAALVLARDPQATPATVLERLRDAALPRSARECPRPCGAGLLNAFGVLAARPSIRPSSGSSRAARASTPGWGDGGPAGLTLRCEAAKLEPALLPTRPRKEQDARPDPSPCPRRGIPR